MCQNGIRMSRKGGVEIALFLGSEASDGICINGHNFKWCIIVINFGVKTK